MGREVYRRVGPFVLAIVLAWIGMRALQFPVPVQAIQRESVFPRIAYSVSMPVPASHLFEVAIDVETPAGQTPQFVDLQMPKWQPGRYSVADFALNVQQFSATGETERLPSAKTDEQTWRVETRGHRSFTASYKVFGNDLSGSFAQLDVTHGNYNGGEIFMYVVGHKQDPVELRIHPPPGWRVINGSTETPNQTLWKYPNYEILIDNPTEVGPDWTMDQFVSGGKTYRVVIHSRGTEGRARARLVRDMQKIVEAEVAMWGPPDFDRYTFIMHFAADGYSRDGMEHLTSTQIIRAGTLDDATMYDDALGNVAHEFFHLWNVKRLRPVELGPWDWTRPPNTKSLWIAEGLTQYYGNLMMHRSGLWSDYRFLSEMSSTISDIENSPGARLMSAVESSMAAPFIDSALHRQRTNLINTSVSYYPKGELIGLVLDLSIRGKTNGQRSLDDVLRKMYDDFYVKSPNASYYLRGRGYTQEDFIRVLSEVAGTDMRGFYDRYIQGVQTLPYQEALAYAGLELVKTPAEKFSSGLNLDFADQDSPRLGILDPGSPAEMAGLQQGDVLMAINGARVDRSDWFPVLDRYKAGNTIAVRVERFGKMVDVSMTLGPPIDMDYRIEEIPAASAAAKDLRAAWLKGR